MCKICFCLHAADFFNDRLGFMKGLNPTILVGTDRVV